MHPIFRQRTVRKPVRERDREHQKFVASQPCLVCGRTPSDAHHIKFAEQRASGRKVSGPLHRSHLPAAPPVNSTGGARSAPGGMARGSIRW